MNFLILHFCVLVDALNLGHGENHEQIVLVRVVAIPETDYYTPCACQWPGNACARADASKAA
jgi:hypothetical protein